MNLNEIVKTYESTIRRIKEARGRFRKNESIEEYEVRYNESLITEKEINEKYFEITKNLLETDLISKSQKAAAEEFLNTTYSRYSALLSITKEYQNKL